MPRPLARRDALRKVKYGRSDMVVSELCAGSMTWGSFNGSEEEAHAQLDCFVKHGVNFFDTAEMYPVAFNYGKTTETWIGNWLTRRIDEGTVKREDLYFATKCNPLGTGGTVGKPGKWKKHAFDADRLRASCEASLSRLQCDYIDLYMLHFPSRMGGEAFGWANWKEGRYDAARTSLGEEGEFEEQVRAVKGLFDANLIRHWGLSNETAYGVTMFCLTCDRLGVPRPVSVQNDFNFNNRTYETSTAEACHHLGVVGMPYGALGGGALTGKYQDARYAGDRPLELARHNFKPKFQTRYRSPRGAAATREYIKLAEAWGLAPAELALAWCRDRPYNAVVVTGTTTVQQCEEAIRAFKLEALPRELLDAIDAIHERYRSPDAALHSKEQVLREEPPASCAIV